MLVIWMILDKVDEKFQLKQVDQLVKVDDIEQEDEVYIKWINWIKWLQNLKIEGRKISNQMKKKVNTRLPPFS